MEGLFLHKASMAKKHGDESKRYAEEAAEEFEALKWGVKMRSSKASAKKAATSHKPGKYDRETN